MRDERVGYCVALGEHDPEAAAAAVPLIDDQGKLHGALLASTIRPRFDAQTLAGSLPASEA
jgi:DNA-binding IclR family transcriptional regulator